MNDGAKKPRKRKEFVYDEYKHIPIARSYLKQGREVKDLCKRLNLTLKRLYEVGKEHPQFGFLIQRICAYSYIPEGEQVYHIEVPWISKFDPETHIKAMIELSRDGKTPAQICAALHIGRATYDNWRATYPVFEDAHQYSKQCFQAYWEDVMARGMRGEIEGFNATAISFFLRNQCKDDYADVKNIATQNTNVLSVLTDEDLKRRLVAKLHESRLLERLPADVIDGEAVRVIQSDEHLTEVVEVHTDA